MLFQVQVMYSKQGKKNVMTKQSNIPPFFLTVLANLLGFTTVSLDLHKMVNWQVLVISPTLIFCKILE